MGLNNIELITDRPLETNLKEIARVKKAHPDRALFVSLMVESKREAWHEITKKTQDAGADGIELNFGCPHGMSERGMGSAVGQVPDYACMITEWVKEVATIPGHGQAHAQRHRCRRRSAARRCAAGPMHSRSSTRSTRSWAWTSKRSLPSRRSAVTAATAATAGRPSSRSRSTWWPPSPPIPRSRCRSAASAASRPGKTPSSSCSGRGSMQVCTAVMHYGFRIVEHLQSGLEGWMRDKGYRSINELVGPVGPPDQVVGRARPELQDRRPDRPGEVHSLRALLYRLRGRLPPVDPLGPRLAPPTIWRLTARATASTRSAGQVIVPGAGGDVINLFTINQETCVGCNMCSLVCPVERCITMQEVDTGQPPMSWNEYQAKLARGEVDPIQPPQHV